MLLPSHQAAKQLLQCALKAAFILHPLSLQEDLLALCSSQTKPPRCLAYASCYPGRGLFFIPYLLHSCLFRAACNCPWGVAIGLDIRFETSVQLQHLHMCVLELELVCMLLYVYMFCFMFYMAINKIRNLSCRSHNSPLLNVKPVGMHSTSLATKN